MRAVRGLLLGPKYEAIIDDLELALNVSRRTAERIYAGQPVNGDATLSVFTHPRLSAPLLSEVLGRVAPERRVELAKAITEAADLIRMKAEQEILLQQIAEKEARR
jgi:hypothetical protein